jgi:CP family cyanate transporter-like MFS transporter
MLLLGILLIAANLRPSITAVGPVLDDIRSSLHLSTGVASVLISIGILHDATNSWSAALVVLSALLAAQLVVSVLASRTRQIG